MLVLNGIFNNKCLQRFLASLIIFVPIYLVIANLQRTESEKSAFPAVKPTRISNVSKKDVIVYLVNPKKIEEFATSVSSVFKEFNSAFQYPVIIFYEKPTRPDELHEVLRKVVKESDFKLLQLVEIKFELPENFVKKHGADPQHLDFTPVFNFKFPGYHHALMFWFKGIFEQPVMQDVEYYWRFDTDSFLKAPINYDIFQSMRHNGYLYGYRSLLHTKPGLTIGLWKFVDSFIAKHKIRLLSGQLDYPTDATEREKFPVPLYYNNFEVLHLPTFRDHEGIRTFSEEVADSLGIYEYRWGDAPLRYLEIAMFLNYTNSVHRFCDIDYLHRYRYKPDCDDVS